MSESKPVRRNKYTTKQLVDMYLLACEKRVAKGTLKSVTLGMYRSSLNRWAIACRRLPPQEILVHHLERWLEAHEDTWCANTQALAVRIVKGWSSWCAGRGFLDADRLRSARGPGTTPRDPGEPGELLRLEAAITCPRFLDWFRVLYDTGCRPGELCHLAAADVDWESSAALVRGKSGERLIGLTQRSLAILRRCSVAWPAGPLLRTQKDCLWLETNLLFWWDKFADQIGVTCTPYACRHALWARWHTAGISDVLIDLQLGHTGAGLKLLKQVYAHADAATLSAAARLAAGQSGKRKRG
jgi:integrase